MDSSVQILFGPHRKALNTPSIPMLILFTNTRDSLMAALLASVLARPSSSALLSGHRYFCFTASLRRRKHLFQEEALTCKSSSKSRAKCFQRDGTQGSSNAGESEVIHSDQNSTIDVDIGSFEDKTSGGGNSFLSMLGIVLGIAAAISLISFVLKYPNQGAMFGIHHLHTDSTSLSLAAPAGAFSFRCFGYRVILPECAPGWVYFWLLMAAGCGLFISEEALNIWVGISLTRLLSLDGTWKCFVDSFSRNAPYIISTVLWVYWGVCVSDMIPFYLGKLFRQSGASDDIRSKLGVGKEKAMDLTRMVQRYGNLIGFVERFSLGVRNPTAFLAGAMLGIGFLLRERPVFALATVASVVGIWTMFPYAVAALTALYFYIRRSYFT